LSKRLELISIIFIFVLTFVLRTFPLGVSGYAWDEARISYDALRVARGGAFLLTGQGSSVGVPFFPASVWAFVPPYLISPDPLGAVIYMTAINALMSIGVWRLARRWSPLAGIVAALFIATNPYAVLYARNIWQPNLLAPLMLAWMMTTYAAISQKRGGFIALSIFVAGIAVQIHFAGAALLAAALIVFIRFRWWKKPRPVIIGVGAVGLCALPYAYFLAMTPGVFDHLGSSGGIMIDLSAAINAVRLALGYEWAYLGAGDLDVVSRGWITPMLVGGVLVAGLLATIRMIVRKRAGGEHEVLSQLALIALSASPILFLLHTSPVLPHYQLITLPAFALIAGAAVNLIAARAWRVGVTALMITVAAIWTVQAIQTFDLVDDQRPPNSALSSILRESRDAARAVMASGDPIIFYAHGDDPLVADGEVTVFETLLWGHPHRIINGDVLLILPPEQTTLLSTLRPIQAWEALEGAGLARAVDEFPRRIGALPFVATVYDGVSEPDGFTSLDPVTFGDGTQLYAYNTRWVGDRWRVSTLWRVVADVPNGVFQGFHHLYRSGDDMNASPFLGADVPLSLHTWRRGDRVIVMADFFGVPPDDDYTLALGHYALADGARVLTDTDADRVIIEAIPVK